MYGIDDRCIYQHMKYAQIDISVPCKLHYATDLVFLMLCINVFDFSWTVYIEIQIIFKLYTILFVADIEELVD